MGPRAYSSPPRRSGVSSDVGPFWDFRQQKTKVSGGFHDPAPRAFKKRYGVAALLRPSYLALLFVLLTLCGPGHAQTAPGTVISNQAELDFIAPVGFQTLPSNRVDIVTVVQRTPALINLTRIVAPGAEQFVEPLGPTSCAAGGVWVALADPLLIGNQSIDPGDMHTIATAGVFHGGEAVFIRLADADQNLDALNVEYVDVELSSTSGDLERIRLSETGPDTGVLAGYVQSANGPAQTVIACCRSASIPSFASVTRIPPMQQIPQRPVR